MSDSDSNALTKPGSISYLNAFFAAACCVSPLGLPASAQSESRPNVVIFFTDDQGTLDANCFGSTDLFTPTIDELAATGVRFTQAYAHLYCCPSRAMLLTGRHPQRTGIHDWAQSRPFDRGKTMLARSEVTLAEALRDVGYTTALFGKWHLGADASYEPTENGFDEFFGHRGGFIDNYLHYFLHGKGFHDLYDGKREVYRNGEYFPDMLTDRAVGFIRKNRGNPFFLYLAYNAPHYPEQADPKFDRRYAQLEMPRRDYAKTISTMDDRMGRVLSELDEQGLRQDTIIVFQSDNGHSIEDYQIVHPSHASGLRVGHNYGPNKGSGNTGRWIGHKGTLFEGGIRVPAIISYVGQFPQGVIRNQSITAMDWMPTLLSLCGVARRDLHFDGHDILAVIQYDAPSPNTVMHWHWKSLWAVREREWKLVQNRNVPLALYNLGDDKPEQEDHVESQPEVVARLQAIHVDWLKDVLPEPDLTLLSLRDVDASGLAVNGGNKSNEVWLFGGHDNGLVVSAIDLAPIVESGFTLTVRLEADRLDGALFGCGNAQDGVTSDLEEGHLRFSITSDGETATLRSDDPIAAARWYTVTAEVDANGHLYLVVKDQDPVHGPGVGRLGKAPRGPIRIGDRFSGRIKDLIVTCPAKAHSE